MKWRNVSSLKPATVTWIHFIRLLQGVAGCIVVLGGDHCYLGVVLQWEDLFETVFGRVLLMLPTLVVSIFNVVADWWRLADNSLGEQKQRPWLFVNTKKNKMCLNGRKVSLEHKNTKTEQTSTGGGHWRVAAVCPGEQRSRWQKMVAARHSGVWAPRGKRHN